MIRCASEQVAKAFAQEKQQPYGFSVFPGRLPWYVGTAQELKQAGVVAPITAQDAPDTIPEDKRLAELLSCLEKIAKGDCWNSKETAQYALDCYRRLP